MHNLGLIELAKVGHCSHDIRINSLLLAITLLSDLCQLNGLQLSLLLSSPNSLAHSNRITAKY